MDTQCHAKILYTQIPSMKVTSPTHHTGNNMIINLFRLSTGVIWTVINIVIENFIRMILLMYLILPDETEICSSIN